MQLLQHFCSIHLRWCQPINSLNSVQWLVDTIGYWPHSMQDYSHLQYFDHLQYANKDLGCLVTCGCVRYTCTHGWSSTKNLEVSFLVLSVWGLEARVLARQHQYHPSFTAPGTVRHGVILVLSGITLHVSTLSLPDVTACDHSIYLHTVIEQCTKHSSAPESGGLPDIFSLQTVKNHLGAKLVGGGAWIVLQASAIPFCRASIGWEGEGEYVRGRGQ